MVPESRRTDDRGTIRALAFADRVPHPSFPQAVGSEVFGLASLAGGKPYFFYLYGVKVVRNSVFEG